MATTSRRAKIRQSILALLVSYLRDGVTSTSLFTYVSGVTSMYPFTQNVWCFTINGELHQITQQEIDYRDLPVGVTIAFGADVPEQVHSMPQQVATDIQIHVRLPRSLVGESLAQQVALKIDQALYRCNGRCEIKDYTVNPSVATTPTSFVSWVSVPRGSWQAIDSGAELEELLLTFRAQYAQPQEEW